MKTLKAKYLLGPVILLTIIAGSCTEFKEPADINSPTVAYSRNPAITQIVPSDSAMAGVREITLIGSNFFPGSIDSNLVYFQGKRAIIKNVAADKIVLYRPVLTDDQYGVPLNVALVVPSALVTSTVKNYKIELPVRTFGDFSRYNYALMAAEVDKMENIYVASRRAIYKMTPDGININTWASLSSDFAKITDMKLGPSGSAQKYLYVLIDKAAIYRLDLNTAAPVKLATFPSVVAKADFDDKGNLYAAKTDGIFVLHQDLTMADLQSYKNIQINELRVYNGYLYAATPKALYRNQIKDNTGKLGPQETVADLSRQAELASCEISSFNIGADGTILLCLKSHPKYSLFVLENDGSMTPYYSAKILPQLVDQMIWGSGRFMYLSRGSLARDSVRFYKMGMDRNSAPYLGR
ncbi:MAG: IPT/TIG domain-containing protein [Syntrophothermus sp.]